MFIQHGQFDVHFNQDRALRIFHGVMRWRKRNNIYGNKSKTKKMKFLND